MWSRVVVLLIFVSVIVVGKEDADDESILNVGQSINVFDHFGYMSLTMRVVPEYWVCSFRHDPRCYFCQQTAEVFDNPESLKVRRMINGRIDSTEFRMEFSNNPQELLQSYFRNFKFEKLPQSWRAYIAIHGENVAARYLGIHRRYFDSDFCYVLMRYAQFQGGVKLSRFPSNATLHPSVKSTLDKVRVGDDQSVYNFIKKYGSHYINSFTTGDSLYQTIVYDRRACQYVQNRLRTPALNISIAELTNLFSPWNAQHVGKIKVTSGNKTIESWIAINLRIRYHIFFYQSLLQIFANPPLLENLNTLLGNEALLSIDMKSMGRLLQDYDKQKWFDDMLDNRLKLWEVNL